ncbi:MAG: DUF86 domain-containing protein [Sedimenticola sp.]
MELDAYQSETAAIARKQELLLDAVQQRLLSGEMLSELEQNGVLHSLQILIENSIGKAKQMLKIRNEPVPTSAYDTFGLLIQLKLIPSADLSMWQAAVGLRNRIVHDYMNLDIEVVLKLVTNRQYQPIAAFLLSPL